MVRLPTSFPAWHRSNANDSPIRNAFSSHPKLLRERRNESLIP